MSDEQRPYSGYAALIGYQLVERGKDEATIALALGPQHMNRLGVPHGGLLATLLDTAAGFAVAFDEGPQAIKQAVTLSLNIHYLGQAAIGDTLRAHARRTGGGKTIAFASAEITGTNGKAIARGDAVFRYLPEKTVG